MKNLLKLFWFYFWFLSPVLCVPLGLYSWLVGKNTLAAMCALQFVATVVCGMLLIRYKKSNKDQTKVWPQEIHGLFVEKLDENGISIKKGWWRTENGTQIHLEDQIDVDVEECSPDRWYNVFLVPRDGIGDPQVFIEEAIGSCGETPKYKNARLVGVFYKDKNGVRLFPPPWSKMRLGRK